MDFALHALSTVLGYDVDELEDRLTWLTFTKWSVFYEQKDAIRRVMIAQRDDTARDWSKESADAVRAAWGAV